MKGPRLGRIELLGRERTLTRAVVLGLWAEWSQGRAWAELRLVEADGTAV